MSDRLAQARAEAERQFPDGTWMVREQDRVIFTKGWQAADANPLDRFLAKIKADAIRDAVEHFEAHVGVEEFRDETRGDGTFWLDTDAVWEAQGPFMDWLRNRADRIEREAGE